MSHTAKGASAAGAGGRGVARRVPARRGTRAAPPGPLGHLPRGPRGGFPTQCLRARSWRASRGFASKIMSMLMSIFGRLGLRLGGHFRSFWRLGRPKLVPRPSSNRLNFEKMSFHETTCFPLVLGVFSPNTAPRNDPRSLQDGPKIVLDRFFCLLIFRFDFCWFWDRFWYRFGISLGIVLGSVWGSFGTSFGIGLGPVLVNPLPSFSFSKSTEGLSNIDVREFFP